LKGFVPLDANSLYIIAGSKKIIGKIYGNTVVIKLIGNAGWSFK